MTGKKNLKVICLITEKTTLKNYVTKQEIYFGNKKPTKQQVRALRFIYCKSRRTFFKELSATKYFYYKFLKVL